MNFFATDRFVLGSDSARALYGEASKLPIFDYHNHLSPQLLYENRNFADMAQFWLQGDHYIWRAMRLGGVEERLITGDAPGKEKFLAWVDVLDTLVGCPLYAWIQMQMAFLFHEEQPLTAANAEAVYDRCNAKLAREDFKPRALLQRFGVTALCTTDEPFDSLEWHDKLRREVTDLPVLPAFRPDKLLMVGDPNWKNWVARLRDSEGMEIGSLDDLKAALKHALARFIAMGCRTSDHGYEGMKFVSPHGAEEVFRKAMAGETVTAAEADAFASALLLYLGELYGETGMVMQLHFGALRNANSLRFAALGADCGVDSVDQAVGVRAIAPLLDGLERKGKLPRTILYCLDESEYGSLMTLGASFAGGGVRSRVQVGSAWWFNDHERGMRNHLTQMMENAMLPGFVGMLTDSRSLGSFVRHDYFRRILCDVVGQQVERGLFPLHLAQKVVNDICYDNACKFFGIKQEVNR